MKLFEIVDTIRGSKDIRNKNAIKNIFVSLNIKGLSILISLIQLPITLNYIGNEQYGIWLTLSSILSWINLFDIGLGHGLRNKLTEALALKNYHKAKIYVSTSYAILAFIVFIFISIFSIINPLINWNIIFNCTNNHIANLSLIVWICFVSISIQFVLKLLNTILIAHQKPAINDAIILLYNVLVTIGVFFLPVNSTNKFFLLTIVFNIIPLILAIIVSIIFFSSSFKFYRPSFRFINFSYSKSLVGLGVNFFFLQIAGLVMFSLTNIFISNFLNPTEVTVYNVAYRYFNVAILIFAIIVTPYWNAYTDAFIKGELNWIRLTHTKLVRIWGLFSLGVLVMVLVSPYVYKIWTRGKVEVPFLLSVYLGLFVVIYNWTSLFLCLINGTGKIRVQIIYALITMVCVFPIIYLFVKILHFGIVGFGLSLVIYNLAGIFIYYIQFHKILNKKDFGIWSK